jgi:TonB family protein
MRQSLSQFSELIKPPAFPIRFLRTKILHMKISRFPVSCFLIASACFPLIVSSAHSQVNDSSLKPAPFFASLFPPVYPPLARQARINGDVVLQIAIRPDGSIASAEVISGHAMLKQAALDSVRKSTFLRQEETERTISYLLTYTFGLRTGPDSGCTDGGTFVRAPRCFYLWKCAWRNSPPTVPAIGESQGRVIILAPAACVEVETSRPACLPGHLK